MVVLDNLSSGFKKNLNAHAIFVEGDILDESHLNDLFNMGFAIPFKRIKFILLSLFFLSCFI